LMDHELIDNPKPNPLSGCHTSTHEMGILQAISNLSQL
jgi:hypothetical protein